MVSFYHLVECFQHRLVVHRVVDDFSLTVEDEIVGQMGESCLLDDGRLPKRQSQMVLHLIESLSRMRRQSLTLASILIRSTFSLLS